MYTRLNYNQLFKKLQVIFIVSCITLHLHKNAYMFLSPHTFAKTYYTLPCYHSRSSDGHCYPIGVFNLYCANNNLVTNCTYIFHESSIFFWWVFYFLVVLLLSSRSYSCGCQVGRESITLNPDCLTLRIIYSGFIYSVLILGTCLNLIKICVSPSQYTHWHLCFVCFDFPEVVPGLFGMMVRVFFSISLKPRRLCGWSHVFVCTLSLSS